MSILRYFFIFFLYLKVNLLKENQTTPLDRELRTEPCWARYHQGLSGERPIHPVLLSKA